MTALARALQTLIGRYDATAFEPARRTRARAPVDHRWLGVGCRAHRRRRAARARRGSPGRPFRRRRGDVGKIAEDVRGGMPAYFSGRLTIRRNLHLGVGFLAATSGAADPGPAGVPHDRDPPGAGLDGRGR